MIVATPAGLGRVLGPSVRHETVAGPLWLCTVYDRTIGTVLLASSDGPFLAVLVGEKVLSFPRDDVQDVNPATLEPLERIWAAVWGR